jgi:osmotically inducible protein OsmC
LKFVFGSYLKGGNVKRKASAVWTSGLKDGKGTVSTDSGVLTNTPYNFSMRFEDAKGTNPEELIAAAHASCFAMATSAQLDGVGIKAQSISATATVALEKVGDGFSVTTSHLDVTIKAPGADRAKVQTAADNAKAGCPISKLLNAKISMEANIEV